MPTQVGSGTETPANFSATDAPGSETERCPRDWSEAGLLRGPTRYNHLFWSGVAERGWS